MKVSKPALLLPNDVHKYLKQERWLEVEHALKFASQFRGGKLDPIIYDDDTQEIMKKVIIKRKMKSKKEITKIKVELNDEKHPRKSKTICPVCEKCFTRKESLGPHLMIHSGERPFPCPTCSKRFRYKCNLETHVRIHSGAKPYECPTCEKRFARTGTLKYHLRMHTGESFKCPKCPKYFSRKAYRNEHSRIHSGEMSECPTCGKLFTGTGVLSKHLITHSRDRPFECLTCSKQFKSKQELTAHKKLHSNVRKYTCNYCQKGFKIKMYLIKHIRVHTGEKPYLCDVCEKRFSQSANLILHKRFHRGDKPYACDICKKAYTEKKSLIGHLTVHSGEKRFICPICKKAFAVKDYLRKHLKAHSHEQREKKILNKKSSSSNPKEFSQKYDELRKRFGCLRNIQIVCHKLTDDEIAQNFSRGYLENAKQEILEQNKPNQCFKVPYIKEESNLQDELADQPTPSCSYQNLQVKEEPTENADPTCINQFDDSFVKEETIFIGNISTII